jgi:protein phosphatase
MTRIDLPPGCLVLLVGMAASGKSTFAARHFAPTEVLSSDAMRALIADDPHAQAATEDAFDLLHRLLAMRLRRERLTVVDATNVEGWARAELLAVARRHRRAAAVIVLDVPLEIALARNAARPAPRPPDRAVKRQHRWLIDTLAELNSEGFEPVVHLRGVDAINGAQITRRGTLLAGDVARRSDP